jgi:hypothetical protein
MIVRTVETSAYEALLMAARTLSDNSFWLDLLAENLYWASMEGFLQSSLLGAFNSGTHGFVADRERMVALRRACRPDLLIMRRSSSVHDEWWTARGHGGPKAQAEYLRLAQAMVQLKVAWTPGNARGSSMLTSKAESVKSDVTRLKSYLKAPSLGVIGVLISGFHQESDGAVAISRSLNALKRAVTDEVDSGDEVTLLTRVRPTRWNPILDHGRAVFSTLWFAQVRPG